MQGQEATATGVTGSHPPQSKQRIYYCTNKATWKTQQIQLKQDCESKRGSQIKTKAFSKKVTTKECTAIQLSKQRIYWTTSRFNVVQSHRFWEKTTKTTETQLWKCSRISKNISKKDVLRKVTTARNEQNKMMK